MGKQFASFLHGFVKQYKKDIFSNVSKCKSLMLDHAKGEYKNEIRLLLQALDMGCYTIIMGSDDLNITRMLLIKQLQEEYYISENIATSLISMLLLELRGYKTIIDKNASTIHEITSIKSNKENNEKLSIEWFKHKTKSVYETVFKEYLEIMGEKGFRCEIIDLSYQSTAQCSICFDFSFVSNYIPDCYPYYIISKNNNVFVHTYFCFDDSDNFDDSLFDNNFLSLNFDKDYKIEELTKEVIISELTLSTEKILLEIEKTEIPQVKNKLNVLNQNLSIKKDEKEIINTDAIREFGSILSTKELSVDRFNENVKIIYEPVFKEYQKTMNENKLDCRYNRRNDFLTNHLLFDFIFVKKFHSYYNANYCISKGSNDNVETRWYFVTNDYNADKEFINEKHRFGIDDLTKERLLNELKLFTEKILSIIKKRHN